MLHRTYLLAIISLALLTPCWATRIQILATGQMHGAFAPVQVGSRMSGGAAAMLDYWKVVEGYTPQTFLVLSTGDNVGGNPLTDRFWGLPAIDVMNTMGYDASVIGASECQWGLAGFTEMVNRATFPYLSANLTNTDGTPSPLFASTIINSEQGVSVGIIGLAYNQAYSTVGLTSSPYETAVRSAYAKLKAGGVQVTIILSSAPQVEMETLATSIEDLNIPLILCGNGLIFEQRLMKYTRVVSNYCNWLGYSRIVLDYNPATRKASTISCSQVQFIHPVSISESADVNAIIEYWKSKKKHG